MSDGWIKCRVCSHAEYRSLVEASQHEVECLQTHQTHRTSSLCDKMNQEHRGPNYWVMCRFCGRRRFASLPLAIEHESTCSVNEGAASTGIAVDSKVSALGADAAAGDGHRGTLKVTATGSGKTKHVASIYKELLKTEAKVTSRMLGKAASVSHTSALKVMRKVDAAGKRTSPTGDLESQPQKKAKVQSALEKFVQDHSVRCEPVDDNVHVYCGYSFSSKNAPAAHRRWLEYKSNQKRPSEDEFQGQNKDIRLLQLLKDVKDMETFWKRRKTLYYRGNRKGTTISYFVDYPEYTKLIEGSVPHSDQDWESRNEAGMAAGRICGFGELATNLRQVSGDSDAVAQAIQKSVLSARNMKQILDAYFVIQHHRSFWPCNLVEGLQHLADIPEICNYVRRDGVDDPTLEMDVKNFLCGAYNMAFSDGRVRDIKETLRVSSRVRLFVWFARGVDERNMASEEFIADVFGGDDRAMVDVLVVCMEFGAERTAKAVYEEMKNRVGRVVWMCLDPSRDHDAVEIFTKTLLPFCARLLPGEESFAECMKALEGRGDEHNCFPPRDGETSGWHSKESSALHSLRTPRVDMQARSCFASIMFRSRKLRQLKVAAEDLHFLDPALEEENLIAKLSKGDSHRYVFLIPDMKTGEEMPMRELEKICRRSRALVLRAIIEIESCIQSDRPEQRISGFQNGIFRVASKDDQKYAWDKLKGKGLHALVWLDFETEEMAELFPDAKTTAAWVSSLGGRIVLSLVITSTGRHHDHVEMIRAGIEAIQEEEDDTSMDADHVKLPRNTIGVHVPTETLVGTIKILPLESQSYSGQARSLLQEFQAPGAAAKALEDALFGIHDNNLCSVTCLYRDTDGSVAVGVLLREVKFLTALRDRGLGGQASKHLAQKLPRFAHQEIRFDPNTIAMLYESMMLELETLTDHQQEQLAKCIETTKCIHIRAKAGTGKTFLALNSILDYLETNTDRDSRVLFVCCNLSLAFQFCKWLFCRFQGARQRRKAQERIFVLTASTNGSPVLHGMEYDAENALLRETQVFDETSLVFGRIVVDEAQDVFRKDSGKKLNLGALKHKISELLEQNGSAKLMLLSDMSQASVPEDSIEFPEQDDWTEVKLNEVCRSSKRVLLGSRCFQLAEDTAIPCCAHESDGLPLRALLISPPRNRSDLYKSYANRIVDALKEVAQQFPGLDLHHRLAMIVPDKTFRDALCRDDFPLLKWLSEAGLVPVSAADASRALPTTKRKSAKSHIILDTVDEMGGLESLIALGIGLDQPINDAAVGSRPRAACSRIYRAITRAQMFFYLINEEVQGGWLEWLGQLELGENSEPIDLKCESSRLSNRAAIELVKAEERRSNEPYGMQMDGEPKQATTDSELTVCPPEQDTGLGSGLDGRKTLNRVWQTSTTNAGASDCTPKPYFDPRAVKGVSDDASAATVDAHSEGTSEIRETPLLQACQRGDKETAIDLLKHGADVHAKDKYGNTPLHEASRNGLCKPSECGLDAHTNGNVDRTPLQKAKSKGHEDVVCELLGRRADIDSRNQYGETPLHFASLNGHKVVVCELIEGGADIRSKNKYGETPLHYASSKGHKAVVCELIERGADINSRNMYGQTPLLKAKLEGHQDVACELLKRGADIDCRNRYGETPLHFASWNGHKEGVCELLDQGADVNPTNMYGESPLHFASANGHRDVVCILLNGGADVHAEDSSGVTPLHGACQNGHTNVIRELLVHGAKVHPKNSHGDTPLHFACESGHRDIVCELLDGGADIHAKDNDGRMPLHLASGGGHKDIVCELLDRGVDIHAKDTGGKTPLDEARRRGRSDVANELVKAAASHLANNTASVVH